MFRAIVFTDEFCGSGRAEEKSVVSAQSTGVDLPNPTDTLLTMYGILDEERPRSLDERRRSSVHFPVKKERYLIPTEKSGDLVVHVLGDISQQDKRATFLTVHDLGCNHYSIEEFIKQPCMQEVKERSIFIHVDVPGHEDNAESIPDGSFPKLQTLGEDLVTVLDFLHVKYVVGFGEGAGANVIARFGIAHPSRTVGLILINCTGSCTTVKENFRAKFVDWKGKEGSASQSAEDYLAFHKFGHQFMKEGSADKEGVVKEFLDKLRGTLNINNVRLYVNAFLNRTDLPLKNYSGDVLIITGTYGSYANVVEKLYKDMDKKQTTLLKIEKVGDVLTEAPAKVTNSILLFCKGLGLLTSVTLPGVDRQRAFSGCVVDGDGKRRFFTRGMSMEEFDKPNLRRFSLTTDMQREQKGAAKDQE